MTAPKRNLRTAQIEAIEWLRLHDEAPSKQNELTDKQLRPDPNHPAVRAIRNFAYTGSFSNKNNKPLMDTFLQMDYLQLRKSVKNYEVAVEALAEKKGVSESSIARRLKPAPMPPEIETLSGRDGLLKWLYIESQRSLRSLRSKRGRK